MDKDKSHFWLRRLHSLSGVVPVGLFLIQHIYANTLALWGERVYNEHVEVLLEQPMLMALELGGVMLPLAFHAALGVWFMMESRFNTAKYAYSRNWMYTLQRVTAWMTLVYVTVHLFQTRFAFSEEQKWSMYQTMQSLFQHNRVWLPILYGVGVVAASFHLCNGIATFCMVWGITVRRETQQRVWLGCMALFVAMSVGGVLSLLPLTGASKPFFGDPVPETHRGFSPTDPYQGGSPYQK
ncbi:MAG: hypothetical protein IT463_06090 [Planctomycetes bacterium]|nr:hypothetical protein [Planctomycetota bacterium]